ncbi:hypothetical protein [Novosphingobium gossypii]|uniref:hypothetical protein n=1 Tax=Novosphingobium gossypii TaxID=1604774 RepID=UPI003D20ECB1
MNALGLRLAASPVWPMRPLSTLAQRMRGLGPLAIAVAPHLLRMTPEEFRMILAGVQASVVAARHAFRFIEERRL